MNAAKELQSARLLWSMSQMSNVPTAQHLASVLHSVLAVCGADMQNFCHVRIVQHLTFYTASAGPMSAHASRASPVIQPLKSI